MNIAAGTSASPFAGYIRSFVAPYAAHPAAAFALLALAGICARAPCRPSKYGTARARRSGGGRLSRAHLAGVAAAVAWAIPPASSACDAGYYAAAGAHRAVAAPARGTAPRQPGSQPPARFAENRGGVGGSGGDTEAEGGRT